MVEYGMQKQWFNHLVDVMAHTRVLVVGDVMLDKYVRCSVNRISPEAPVPIALVNGESFFLGGAGNVAHNIRALGATVSLCGVIGDDSAGRVMLDTVHEQGIEYKGLITEMGRMTTVKERMVSGTQQLLRVDRETSDSIQEDTQEMLASYIEAKLHDIDVVVISDYCKGVMTDRLIDAVKQMAAVAGKKVFVDSKHAQLARYADVYVLKPNKHEAEHHAGERFLPAYENLETIGKRLAQNFNTHMVITLGSDGIALFEDEYFRHITTRAQQVFDVSGAGDTVLGVMATAIAAGAKLDAAVELSNIAAGYVVSCLGTTVCTEAMLRKCIDDAFSGT